MEAAAAKGITGAMADRKSTRLNSSHVAISYAVFCLKKKNNFSLLLIAYFVHQSAGAEARQAELEALADLQRGHPSGLFDDLLRKWR